MSDIYLQITETPTVVTLSAPVISGALSSTVTVANTVTVALDANSLSALENVTVTVGAAITGTVTVGNSVTISSLPAISGTVTIGSSLFSKSTGAVSMPTQAVLIGFGNDSNQNFVGVNDESPLPVQVKQALPAGTNRIGVVTIGGGTVTIGAGTAQIGSVTASLAYSQTATTIASTTVTAIPVVFPTGGAYGGSLQGYNGTNTYIYSGIQAIGGTSLASATSLPVSLSTLPALVAGTAQIGSVTASISGTVPVSGTFWQATQPVSLTSTTVTVSSLPALVAGTAQIGSVTASISGTVPISISSVTVGNSVTIGSLPAISGTVTANTFAVQGTAVTTSNFTSTTASTVLASYNATREVLTIFNEGAGNLHVCVGATCTTVAYQVRLSAGDYYEAPNHQTTITHSAVFATAGTARVTQVS
jgi:hypothetical protein